MISQYCIISLKENNDKFKVIFEPISKLLYNLFSCIKIEFILNKISVKKSAKH